MRKPFLRFLEVISLLQKVIRELLPASGAENRVVCHYRIAAGAIFHMFDATSSSICCMCLNE
jgi:hypothetical protein